MKRPWFATILVAACALSACAGGQKVPDWSVNAVGHVERFSEAYLRGDSRVAAREFDRARAETARTGRPDHVGVIGVAVFREKAVPPPPIAPRPWPRDGRFSGGAPAASADAAGPAAESAARQRAPASPQTLPRNPARQGFFLDRRGLIWPDNC